MDDEKDKTPPSKFNAGILKLERIHKIRDAIHQAWMNDDSNTTRILLQRWRSEINDRLSRQERLDADKYQEEINDAMIKRTVNTVMGKVRVLHKNYRKNLYEYELYLADMEKKHGLGMPDKDDARWSASN